MRNLFSWLFRIISGLIILAIAAAVLAYYLASRSLPDYNRTVEVAGLSAPVEILRDNANVPHILGQSDADVFFGLGFAHAQDRLWQMTLMRRTAQGRLSEVFGEATLEVDSYMRRMNLYALARSSVSAQSPQALSALGAYAAGVNARIDQINAEALGRGAPEFFLFDVSIAPWHPADSLAIAKLMAVQLSGNMKEEILRARMALALPDQDMLRDILPDVPGPPITALPVRASALPHRPAAPQPIPAHYQRLKTAQPLAQSQAARHPLMPIKPRGLSGASNAWAVAPERSASNGTLLANDPHLNFSAPAIWYLARLELRSGGVIGGTIPGMPLVVVGRSSTLGWGMTYAFVDAQDLYIEKLNPENPNEYLTPEGWMPFETRSSIIRVKDADPVTLTLRWTQNGPVLPGSFENLASITPPGHVVALNWTALSGHDTSVSAGIDLMSAKTIAQAIDVAELHIAPAQNLTLADQDSIAMKIIGLVPKRDPAHTGQGRLPGLGYERQNRWQGRMPYASNPSVIAPESGILGNTNNKTSSKPFPNHITFDWGDSQRIQRWSDLMQARQLHTRDSFVEAQLDTVSFAARTLLPLIGAELWFNGEAALPGTIEYQRQRALALLAEWNGEMNEYLPEPLIYAAWLRALQERLVRDEIGVLTDELRHVDPLFIERVFRDIDGAARWCDVHQSAIVETCAQIARRALDDALLNIMQNYGPDLEALRWGDAHQATHDHAVLGDLPILGHLMNIRQSTSGGDQTLQRGRTRGGLGPDGFENVHGAAYRGIYDFSDPDSSVFVISTGQSGHPLSRHYDDQAQLWRRGEFVPMSLDTNLARGASVGTTILQPVSEHAD